MMSAMKEPINFDKLDKYILINFKADPPKFYKIDSLERVGVNGRKFWVIPADAKSNGLQFVIYWQSNPMIPAIDTVEVELYKNDTALVRYGKKRYSIERDSILTMDAFTEWVKTVITDFEPELSNQI